MIFAGFLLAAIILSLLVAAFRGRRNRKTSKTEAEQSAQERTKEEAAKTTAEEYCPSRKPEISQIEIGLSDEPVQSKNLDEAIKSGFDFLGVGAYELAIKSFQEGLTITNNSGVSMQLYLELAKIHNLLGNRDQAVKYIDSALESCRKSKNGATEQEIEHIKEILLSK